MPVQVLIAEDDAELRVTVAKMFRPPRFMVRTASSGREAFDLFVESPADLIITDQMMPNGTGTELIGLLKNRGAKPKIILMTGYTNEILDSVLATGLKVLHKPFSKKVLFSIVDEYFPESIKP